MDQISSPTQNPAPNPPLSGSGNLMLIGAIGVLLLSVAGVGSYIYFTTNNLDTSPIASLNPEEYDVVVDLNKQDQEQESNTDKDLSLLSDEDVFCSQVADKWRDLYCDDDGDGFTNGDEKGYKTDPNDPDTDGDGYNDGDEYYAGYNPRGEGSLYEPICEEGDNSQRCIEHRVIFIDQDESKCSLIQDEKKRDECAPTIRQWKGGRLVVKARALRDLSICDEISTEFPLSENVIRNCELDAFIAEAVVTLDPQSCLTIQPPDQQGAITSCVARMAVIIGDYTACGILEDQEKRTVCETAMETELRFVDKLEVGITNNDLQKTKVVEEIGLTDNDNGGGVLVDCGDSRFADQGTGKESSTFEERKQFNTVYNCLKEQFASCTPAKGSLYTGTHYTSYQIEGIVSGKCLTGLSYYHPRLSSLDGKTMICSLDNSASLFLAAADATQCSGTYFDWMLSDLELEPVDLNMSKELYTYDNSNGNISWEYNSFRGITKLTITDDGVKYDFTYTGSGR